MTGRLWLCLLLGSVCCTLFYMQWHERSTPPLTDHTWTWSVLDHTLSHNNNQSLGWQCGGALPLFYNESIGRTKASSIIGYLPECAVRILVLAQVVPIVLSDSDVLDCIQTHDKCVLSKSKHSFEFTLQDKQWDCLRHLLTAPAPASGSVSQRPKRSATEKRETSTTITTNTSNVPTSSFFQSPASLNLRRLGITLFNSSADDLILKINNSDTNFVVHREKFVQHYVQYMRNGVLHARQRYNVRLCVFGPSSNPEGTTLNNEHVVVLCPSDIALYLRQSNSSTFIPCRHDLYSALKSANPKQYEKTLLPLSMIDEMALFRDLLLNHSMSPMLFGGTLLGWYRECGLIPDTTDLDLVAFATEYSDSLEKALIWNGRFKLYWILGLRNDSLEISVYSSGNKIDLFFLYPNTSGNGMWVGGMFVPKRQKLKWKYPTIRQLCSADLYGHLFNVPCNVEAVLQADYGPDWATPFHDAKFKWYASHHNIEKGDIWSKSIWSKVYRTSFA